MDEHEIRRYFAEGFILRLLTMVLVGLGMAIGVIYLVLYQPMFAYNDYFQVASVIAIIFFTFMIATLVMAPFEYRLDRNYGRTTLGFLRYFSYRFRSRLLMFFPFAIMLVLFTMFYLVLPADYTFSTPFTFLVTVLTVLVIGLIMPRIYGSMLKKEKIDDPKLSELIRDLSDKMGIKGGVKAAYRVPVKGFRIINAAQLGFSQRQRRVYLIGDIEKLLTEDQIQAVVAHEFAHINLRHILRLSLILISLMALTYIVFTFLALTLSYYLLASSIITSVETLVTAFTILNFTGPFIVVYLVLLRFRRKYEFEADRLAARMTKPESLATSLMKLAEYNLLPQRYPRGLGALQSHPSIAERIEKLQLM